MKKNYFALLFAMAAVAGKGTAQVLPCYSDEVRQKQLIAHPEMLKYEADFERQVQEGLKKIDYSKARTTEDRTNDPNFWYDIPVVVHVVHNYGVEYLPDTAIYEDLALWNLTYAKLNPDTSQVITPYKKWIGNPRIRLHFATVDPYGNPTHGITHHLSYLTYTAGEQAKFGNWPQSSYVNIWCINVIPASGGFTAAAYATPPASAASNPRGDGILCDWDYMRNETPNGSKTINHEMGHMFNLAHPWGNNNSAASPNCGDDGVDDTPPTKGHVTCAVNDSSCAVNYFKIYTSSRGTDSLVNYPDTTNVQNIMDYSYCMKMFTIGQCTRMHQALNSDVGGRNNLWNKFNLIKTGVLADSVTGEFAAFPDLKPIPDFVINPNSGQTNGSNYMDRFNNFIFPTKTVRFYNKTWNDTVTALNWKFSNGAQKPDTTTSGKTYSYIDNSFSEPGWGSVTMKATGNHTGDSTITFDRAFFVANVDGTPAENIMQDFNPSGDVDSWPTFNYYNNEFKWKLTNTAGVYDNNSLMYEGYDSRILGSIPAENPYVGCPKGDFDDFFTTPVNFTSFSGPVNMNFLYSSASRSSVSLNMNDVLEIDYSIGKSPNWTNLVKLTKGTLHNKGAFSNAYTPGAWSDWDAKTISLPSAVRSADYVVFRFRYKPGVGQDATYSSGNNFYMDRLHFSSFPASVSSYKMGDAKVAVVPNPTNGDAYVIVKDVTNDQAQIVVSDVTGKAVYTTKQQVYGSEARILIPQSAISVKGLYLVQVTTGNQTSTQKLVVY